jgi:hypothetical protein
MGIYRRRNKRTGHQMQNYDNTNINNILHNQKSTIAAGTDNICFKWCGATNRFKSQEATCNHTVNQKPDMLTTKPDMVIIKPGMMTTKLYMMATKPDIAILSQKWWPLSQLWDTPYYRWPRHHILPMTGIPHTADPRSWLPSRSGVIYLFLLHKDHIVNEVLDTDCNWRDADPLQCH